MATTALSFQVVYARSTIVSISRVAEGTKRKAVTIIGGGQRKEIIEREFPFIWTAMPYAIVVPCPCRVRAICATYHDLFFSSLDHQADI